MTTQVCEYCRSRVERSREECKNCGAPVQKFDPAYNSHNSPYFVNDAYNPFWQDALNEQAMAQLQNAANWGNIQHVGLGNRNVANRQEVYGNALQDLGRLLGAKI